MTEPHRPRVKYVIGPDGSPLTIADLAGARHPTLGHPPQGRSGRRGARRAPVARGGLHPLHADRRGVSRLAVFDRPPRPCRPAHDAHSAVPAVTPTLLNEFLSSRADATSARLFRRYFLTQRPSVNPAVNQMETMYPAKLAGSGFVRPGWLGQSVQGLIEFVRTLGAARLAAMAAVTAALIGIFAFIILRVSAPQMAAGLHRSDAGRLRRGRQGPRAPGDPL